MDGCWNPPRELLPPSASSMGLAYIELYVSVTSNSRVLINPLRHSSICSLGEDDKEFLSSPLGVDRQSK